MDFKQRILTAMSHEEPDRVPVMGLIMDQATVNQVLGREATDFLGMLEDPSVGSEIRGLLNTDQFWNKMYYGNFAGAMEAAIKLGFDANWSIYSLMQLHADKKSLSGFAWHDVFGRVFEMASDQKGNLMFNYSRALCETEAEWEAWVESKAPLFERMIENAADFHRKLVDEYGDEILPLGFAAPGIFENSWQPMGFVSFTKLIYQKPEFVKRIIEFQTNHYIRHLEGVMRSGVDVVIGGDDLGQKTGPMMRPELVEKLYGESYRRVAETVHGQNKKFIFHSCGNIYPLLEKFIEWGFDGIITMEPTAGMELEKVRERVGHKLVLIGNLDVSYLLVKGSRQEIEDGVKKAIKAAASGGGYILSTAHSHSLVDATRLQWMVDAAHEHGRYPIRV